MERLGFSDGQPYDGLEAVIHIARYSFVRELCADKTVLDLACGEGYGSKLMSDWGARRVVGIDVSRQAIENARARFGSEAVEFRTADATDLLEHLRGERFDLIVSLETIEHVENPARLLTDFRELLNPGGVLVVSCPNDWWYYPAENESNPYHRRKYRFDEFRALAEGVMGPARAWYLGGPQAGFVNLRLDATTEADASSTQELMLDVTDATVAMSLPAEYKRGLHPAAASYFIGVWTDSLDTSLRECAGVAMLPSSMDAFNDGFFAQTAQVVPQLRQELAEVRAQLARAQREDVVGLGDATLAELMTRVEALRADLKRCSQEADLASNDSPDSRLRYALLREQACEMERDLVRAQLAKATDTRRQEQWLRQQLLAVRSEVSRAREAEASLRKRLSEILDQHHQVQRHLESLTLEAHRYRRIRDAIPANARRAAVWLLRKAKSVVAR